MKNHLEYNKTDPAYDYAQQISLGPWTSYSYLHDPTHLLFVLSRYKFCAKMLKGRKNVLEVGCGDGFGIPLVAQVVDYVTGIDLDKKIISSNIKRLRDFSNISFKELDMLKEIPSGKFDGIYAIDVIEHIPTDKTKRFIQNIQSSLKDSGICIVGTPNITSDKYASRQSKLHHINLQSYQSLLLLMQKYFTNVFMFGMNDEVVHTGYPPMCHYLFAVGVGKK